LEEGIEKNLYSIVDETIHSFITFQESIFTCLLIRRKKRLYLRIRWIYLFTTSEKRKRKEEKGRGIKKKRSKEE